MDVFVESADLYLQFFYGHLMFFYLFVSFVILISAMCCTFTLEFQFWVVLCLYQYCSIAKGILHHTFLFYKQGVSLFQVNTVRCLSKSLKFCLDQTAKVDRHSAMMESSSETDGKKL